jgi:hypothetical protein
MLVRVHQHVVCCALLCRRGCCNAVVYSPAGTTALHHYRVMRPSENAVLCVNAFKGKGVFVLCLLQQKISDAVISDEVGIFPTAQHGHNAAAIALCVCAAAACLGSTTRRRDNEMPMAQCRDVLQPKRKMPLSAVR